MKGRNTGTIIGLVCGFIVAGSTATMGITDMKEQLEETKDELGLYKELNERQQDIILEYKVVSGIDVSSITKTLDNKELIKQLDEKIKKLEEK
ncbi:hypothetical protein [Enterococcus phage vB_EfaS_Ef5.2]|nr:hypothetical protein [Enterococcus phage vB_EfaS_Ef5.2]